MSKSIQRLSTGFRINSAQDDAAGLAIADRMTSQIRGMDQAARNANDGISLAQVAEGAMEETTNMLQRMRELAIQSANGSNSDTDRKSIQAEITQLTLEMDQVAANTQFNGQKLLDGSFTNGSFQVGANANETINFSIGAMNSKALGGIVTATGTDVTATATTSTTITMGTGAATTINTSANYTGSYNGQDATSAYAKTAAINDAKITGLSATASTSGSAILGSIGGGAGDTYNLTINGTSIFNNQDASTALTNAQLLNAINSNSGTTGVVGSLVDGNMTLTAADGRNIDISEGGTNFVAGTNGMSSTTGSFAGDSVGTVTVRGQITLNATESITLGGDFVNLSLNSSITSDNLGVGVIDVSTQAGAQTAITRIDSALQTIDSNRANLGAIQNRFDSTILNLQSVSDSTSAAKSRIKDTDFAVEMAALTKNQILQQAGTAMLSQANSMPQSVLSLLG
jgi:flagellin